MTTANNSRLSVWFHRLKPVLLVIFLVLFASYAWRNQQDFQSLGHISVLNIGLILSLQLAIIASNTFILITLCRPYGIHLKTFDSLFVTLKSSLINFVGFLQGGVGYKAIYLNKRHQLKYRQFVALYGANYVVIFAVSSIMALVGLGWRVYNQQTSQWVVGLVFAAIATVMLAVINLKRLPNLPGNNKFSRLVSDIFLGWQQITKSPGVVLRLFCLASLQALAMAGLFYVELQAIGVEASVGGTLIYAGIANLALLVAFTPAAIGFREGLLLFAQGSLGVSTSAILVSSTVDRAIYIVILLLTLLALQAPLQRWLRRRFVD